MTFWGTLQIRIQFVRQRGNRGKPRYPLLPLKQTNISKTEETLEETIICHKRFRLKLLIRYVPCKDFKNAKIMIKCQQEVSQTSDL